VMAALVPRFGIDGAAVAVFAGSLVQITVMFRMSRSLYPIHFAVRPALAFVAAYVVFMGILYVGQAFPPILFFVVRAAGAIAFVVSAYLTLLDKRERARLRRC
jgi:O-antigen/teichoic acid export membrane protein